MKILFIGNSATYVHNIPETLARLAAQAGYELETKRIVKGGYKLSQHADLDTEHGQLVRSEVEKKYDIAVLQDNGNCISSDEMRAACIRACHELTDAAQASGSRVYYYVRPPYGYEVWGRNPLEQCREFDCLFGEIAEEKGAVCVYVNRAFAYAVENTNIRLWGDDNAHTSEEGAYLAVCVFFATIFGKSATLLDSNGINEAKMLQEIADKVVFKGE